ncbi:MAG: glutamate--tRNA ligase [Candidatus Cryptobacteroides sp.]
MERRTRVRFAPSPTGPLHMGGVRTALYNYLYAKQHGGDFILRIEDTDSHRFVPGAEEYIIEALSWCGIKPDEGVDENGKVVETPSAAHPHAPYRQSQRRSIYKQYAEMLVESGNAYYAFDTPGELDARRAGCEASGQTFIYNRMSRMTLRNSLTLSPEETERLLRETNDWTIRFKMPQDTVVKMDDLIRGHVEINTDTLDDKVLWKKADELPTYHLANIVDDHLMEITEVIRGEEWLPSLPLHYLLYEAFGWQDTMPRFAHLPLLLKPVGNGKLSKRDGDKMGFPVFPLNWVNSEGETYHGYREDGYFPGAFVNLLAMLGWNPGTEQEIFTMEQLIDSFSIEKVSKAGAKFNPEKARWFNKEYLRATSDEELTALFIPILEEKGISVTSGTTDLRAHKVSADYVRDAIAFTKERATFVKDFWTIASCLFVAPEEYSVFGIKAGAQIEPKAADNRPKDPRVKEYDDSLTAPFLAKDADKFWKGEIPALVASVSEYVKAYDGEWTVQGVGESIEDYIRTNGWPMGKVMNAIRLALAGSASGLGIADIITRIGREETSARIAYAQARLG